MKATKDELVELRKTKQVEEIAEQYNVSEKTISRWLKSYGLTNKSDRTDISDEDVLNDYNDGLTINQIATKYQCSHDTVTKRLAKYNISNTRADGIRRHFEPTYEERWADIKEDLDKGIAVSIVRDKHHIRMENLEALMKKHNYKQLNESLYDEVLDLIESVENSSLRAQSKRARLRYLNAIKFYIESYHTLPDFTAIHDITGVSMTNVRDTIKRAGLCKFVRTNGVSSWVSVLIRYFEEHNVVYELNNRKILMSDDNIGQEMDFYLPDYNIGIEVNPVGTHSVDVQTICIDDKMYHQRKSLLAEKYNVGLVHMYDEDFVDEKRFNRIMTMILTKPSMHYGARQCDVKQISAQTANEFLNRYHLQGGETGSRYRYGLYHNDELCSVLTLGKPRFTGHDYEIVRYCVRPDVAVIGGFQKLLSEFKKKCKSGDTIVSYMDLNKRFSGQNIYEKSGFEFEKITQPDYVWTNKYGTHTLKRYDTTKTKLIEQGYDGTKTEKQIMLDRGYFRVYGAGSKRYVYTV